MDPRPAEAMGARHRVRHTGQGEEVEQRPPDEDVGRVIDEQGEYACEEQPAVLREVARRLGGIARCQDLRKRKELRDRCGYRHQHPAKPANRAAVPRGSPLGAGL